MLSFLDAVLRLAAYIGLTLLALPVQIVGLLAGARFVETFPGHYHRLCLRIFGLTLHVTGCPIQARPVLFVANHSSYLDIMILAALIDGSFVAKKEIASWPVFGLLAQLQRTVFIARQARHAKTQQSELQKRLLAGDRLILFPEGTSSDGNHVLQFKSALFSVAEEKVAGRDLPVQPVSIAYTGLNGLPMGRRQRPFFAWYGEMGLAPHMWRGLRRGRCRANVVFHPPLVLADFADRKAMAAHCRERVAAGVAAALSGRLPDAAARTLVPPGSGRALEKGAVS